jgi:hypothetical protein
MPYPNTANSNLQGKVNHRDTFITARLTAAVVSELCLHHPRPQELELRPRIELDQPEAARAGEGLFCLKKNYLVGSIARSLIDYVSSDWLSDAPNQAGSLLAGPLSPLPPPTAKPRRRKKKEIISSETRPHSFFALGLAKQHRSGG